MRPRDSGEVEAILNSLNDAWTIPFIENLVGHPLSEGHLWNARYQIENGKTDWESMDYLLSFVH
jgi:hypothetical protein